MEAAEHPSVPCPAVPPPDWDRTPPSLPPSRARAERGLCVPPPACGWAGRCPGFAPLVLMLPGACGADSGRPRSQAPSCPPTATRAGKQLEQPGTCLTSAHPDPAACREREETHKLVNYANQCVISKGRGLLALTLCNKAGFLHLFFFKRKKIASEWEGAVLAGFLWDKGAEAFCDASAGWERARSEGH